MVDATDSKSVGQYARGGSNPPPGTELGLVRSTEGRSKSSAFTQMEGSRVRPGIPTTQWPLSRSATGSNPSPGTERGLVRSTEGSTRRDCLHANGGFPRQAGVPTGSNDHVSECDGFESLSRYRTGLVRSTEGSIQQAAFTQMEGSRVRPGVPASQWPSISECDGFESLSRYEIGLGSIHGGSLGRDSSRRLEPDRHPPVIADWRVGESVSRDESQYPRRPSPPPSSRGLGWRSSRPRGTDDGGGTDHGREPLPGERAEAQAEEAPQHTADGGAGGQQDHGDHLG